MTSGALVMDSFLGNLQEAIPTMDLKRSECYVTNAFYELVIHLCFLFLSFVLCSVHPIYHRLYHYSPCLSFFDTMEKWTMDQ